jgi:DNA-binding winged helix-turn-helix (wHTH) protein/TolB-like protein/Flp pilus assembly protein TadD
VTTSQTKGYTGRSFRLGSHLVDPSTNAIGNARVDPKAMDVLVALAEAAPEVLSAAALLDRVWPNVVVGDNSLYQAIAQLRRALGDQARTPRFIEHVPRRGYRLLVPVESLEQSADNKSNASSSHSVAPLSDAATTAEVGASKSAESLLNRRRLLAVSGVAVVTLVAILAIWSMRGERAIKTVAVFPFENLTGDLMLDEIAQGVSDELRRRLGPISQLRIVSGNSVESPQLLGLGRIEAAALLGTTHMVRGQVQRAGEAISVVVQLEDARGEKLWSGRFQRDQAELLELQTDVNASVVNALVDDLGTEQQALLRQKPTNDARAWELYLRARRFKDRFTLDAVDAAIAQLEEAITRDPGFALAYASLADAHQGRQQMAHLPPEEGLGRAQSYVDEALRLDPRLAEAQTVAAIIRDAWLWDAAGAERMYLRAIELDPNLPEAWEYLTQHYLQFGEWQKARKPAEQVHRLDPLGNFAAVPSISVPLIGYWYSRDRRLLDKALVHVDEAKQLDPRNWNVYMGECMVRFARGEFAQAVEAGRRARQYLEDSKLVEPDLAAALVRTGHREEAEAIVESLEMRASQHYFSPSRLAMAHAALGNIDRSLELLEAAVKDRDWEIFFVIASPPFDAMRSLPRFQRVYRTLGIPEPAQVRDKR